MKTDEQRRQETALRVRAFPTQLRDELALCINTNTDSANFLLRNGYVRGRGRGSPWIGSIEHVQDGLGVSKKDRPEAPPSDSKPRLFRLGCLACAVACVLGLFLLVASSFVHSSSIWNRLRPVANQGELTGSGANEDLENPIAEMLPGAAPMNKAVASLTSEAHTWPPLGPERLPI